MKTRFPSVRPIAILISCLLAVVLPACESGNLEDRLDRRNNAYKSFQDRREMRQDARQERTDAWFERVMD